MNTDKKDGLSRKDLQSEYLKQYNDMINRTNRNSFRYVSLMSLFVFLGIMVISACTGHFGIRFILYSSGAVFTLIMHLLFQLDVKRTAAMLWDCIICTGWGFLRLPVYREASCSGKEMPRQFVLSFWPSAQSYWTVHRE